MFRAIAITFQNEFRLLSKDRVGLFMLLLAPVVIISVAGLSLGNIYGTHAGTHAYLIPVVDQDHGRAANSIVDALEHESSVAIVKVADLAQAQEIVAGRDRAPLAMVIPPGTTIGLESGGSPRLLLYVDPIKRLEVSAIELHLFDLCRRISEAAQTEARHRLAALSAGLQMRLSRLSGRIAALEAGTADYRREMAQARSAARATIQSRMSAAIDDLQAATANEIQAALEAAKAAATADLASRRDAIVAVQKYLVELQTSEGDFDRWIGALRTAAGSHGSAIPPPPAFPAPPSPAVLAELSKPVALTITPPVLPKINAARAVTSFAKDLKLPKLPMFDAAKVRADIEALTPAAPVALPGVLSWSELSASGGRADVNAFDQYVPGFGITFLLIGMLMGISLGLIDERDWGTLARLRVSGAPLTATLIGKLLARFVVGLSQMIVLFAVGWCLFNISLGRVPLMLVLPAASISFAAAAFGLVIACIARTHDSVMPFGAVVSMAMSAIGGCWWPLDFEPAWMRALARWMPTTWTMEAFNNLMIRDLPAASALEPSAVTVGLGVIFLAVGIIGAAWIYDQP